MLPVETPTYRYGHSRPRISILLMEGSFQGFVFEMVSLQVSGRMVYRGGGRGAGVARNFERSLFTIVNCLSNSI